jgi:hypothetical protein
MMAMTEALIEGVKGLGGGFYLPYRLHARRDQVRSIYLRTEEFVAAKRRRWCNGTAGRGLSRQNICYTPECPLKVHLHAFARPMGMFAVPQKRSSVHFMSN